MRVAAVVLVALVAAAAAGGANHASKLVERTLLCTVPEQDTFPDPTRTISVTSVPKRGQWSASTSVFTLNAEDDQAQFAVGLTTGSTPKNPRGYLAWTRAPRCGPSSKRVPFSSAGLEGGATRFAKEVECDVPAQVVVHVKAVFTKPVDVGLDARVPSQLFAKGNISSGQLVVATPGGKRLAYGSADGATGKVKLFAAKFPACS
jgi:hypothetical protein